MPSLHVTSFVEFKGGPYDGFRLYVHSLVEPGRIELPDPKVKADYVDGHGNSRKTLAKIHYVDSGKTTPEGYRIFEYQAPQGKPEPYINPHEACFGHVPSKMVKE